MLQKPEDKITCVSLYGSGIKKSRVQKASFQDLKVRKSWNGLYFWTHFEHLKEWEPNTPMSQTEEEIVVEDDEPLLLFFSFKSGANHRA